MGPPSGGLRDLMRGHPVPWEQLVDPDSRVIRDAREDVGEPDLRIDVVESGGLDERVEGRGALAAAIGAAEQPRLPAQGYAPQGALGGIVGEADPAIIKEPRERFPATKQIVDRLGEIMVSREYGTLGGEPGVELVHQGCAETPAYRETIGGGLAGDGAFDVEQGIEPSHCLERDRVDHASLFAAAVLASRTLDVCKLEELAPRVREATSLAH